MATYAAAASTATESERGIVFEAAGGQSFANDYTIHRPFTGPAETTAASESGNEVEDPFASTPKKGKSKKTKTKSKTEVEDPFAH